MKTIKQIFGSAVFAATVSASGAAIAIPITDVVDPENVTIAYQSWYTFTHDITDNGFVVGDTLDSASLSILLRDEDAGNEVFQFVVGTSQTAGYTTGVSSGAGGELFTFNLNSASISDLGSDGSISVTIRSLEAGRGFQSGFIFDKSTLTAQVTKGGGGVQQVPEPASLALLGIGLVGLGAMRRRKTA